MVSDNSPVSVFRLVDKWVILIYLLLVIGGCFSIYGATYDFDQTSFFDLSGRTGMQLIWIGTAFIFAFLLLLIDRHFIEIFAYVYYALMILLLIVTIFVAPDIKGSRSWLVLGPLRIQPAEFAKVTTALALAKLLSDDGFRLKGLRNYALALFIIFFPLLLVVLQKEAGSALVFLSLLIVLYAEGMPGMVLASGGCLAAFFIVALKFPEEIADVTPIGYLIDLCLIYVMVISMIFRHFARKSHSTIILIGTAVLVGGGIAIYVHKPYDLSLLMTGIVASLALFLALNGLYYRARKYLYAALFALLMVGFVHSVEYAFNDILEPHQQMRIKVTLGLEDDPAGAGYNVNQSKIAIGSGGIFGKGFLNGTQTKLKYVPEQDTDFIFCTVGEEQGFFGSLIVIGLFFLLIVRVFMMSEKHIHAGFVRIYGYCVASILAMHVAINIGMVIGMMPVIGIPLPFFSYGGSSLWGFTIMLFIFLKLDATEKEKERRR